MRTEDILSPTSKQGNEEVSIVVESLKSELEKELEPYASALINNPYTVRIYGVSERYRKSNEDAYTPRVVSIGPLHHGKSHLKLFEEHKLRSLLSFKSKCHIKMDDLIIFASKMEDKVRSCYEDTSRFESKNFSRMILLDGVLFIQLLLHKLRSLRDDFDKLLECQWRVSDLMHDMLLIENQLPLDFIRGLFAFIGDSLLENYSFDDLLLSYLRGVWSTKELKLKLTVDCKDSRHLVEFLVNLHSPTSSNTSSNRRPGPSGRCEYPRSASRLHAAGVRFDQGLGGLLDVSFDDGILQLSQLTVNDKTKTFFRNLIAYEQCGHYDKYITSYIILMDSLIDTAEDVELLVSSGIIENLLGEKQQVADLFNNLCKEVIMDQKDFYFDPICNNLNIYSKDYIHEWKSTWFRWKLLLKNQYFSFLSCMCCVNSHCRTNCVRSTGTITLMNRYVDTFNKGGGNQTNMFQSPSVPSVKAKSNASRKFFVPEPVSGQTLDSAADGNQQTTSGNLASISDSFQSFTPPSSMNMQRFASMDDISKKRTTPGIGNGSLPPHSRRAASWSGSIAESFSPPSDTETKPLGQVLGMPPSLFMPTSPALVHSSAHGGSYGDDLHEVEL